MNIIQALRTGRPFRRRVDVEMYGPDFWVTDSEFALGREDVLADDWEVQPEPAKEPEPVDRSARVLTDGSPETPDHREIDPATGMQKGYVVLSEEERKKGFVRPVRRTYIHEKCGVATTMSQAIAETYSRSPDFYGATFCVHCKTHFPVGENGEFVWEDGSKVGT